MLIVLANVGVNVLQGKWTLFMPNQNLQKSYHTDRNFVDNFLQVEIYLALVANI